MIVIELLPTSAERQPGEGLEVDVHLRNGGVEAEVTNPAALRATPLWRLIQLPDGTEYVTGNEQGYAPPPGQPERLRLATGESWDGRVIIRSADVPLTPGPWAVTLLLSVDGAVEEGPPCIARVADWAIGAAGAGWGVPGENEEQGDTLMLQRPATSKPALYRMPWRDDDSDRTGTGAATPIMLGTVGPEAADPLVPVRDGPFWIDTAQWFLWREGATIFARGMGGERQELTLPEAPAALLRPALQRVNDDILVLALSADRQRLDRCVFSHDGSTLPIVAGDLALPVAVSAGTAAFAKDGDVLVGLSGATPEGTALLLIDRGGAGTPRVVVLPAATPIPDAAPALLVHPDGTVVLGTLVSTETGIAVAEARFAQDSNATPAVVARPLGESGAHPIGGAMLYSAPHGTAETHGAGGGTADWPSLRVVIRLADGTLLRLGLDGTLNPATYEAPPVPPLILVPASHGAWLLCCDPRLGPFMVEA